MLYHGGVAVASGGFLGVDVFFVLSGFLITTLLLLEFEATGRLDLPAFWGRRARRLLPALFLVLAGVLLYAAFLRGEAAASVRADTVATLFYVSNWWFIASGNSYFEQFQDPSPLAHTWSLAIEEQWYLLLPLALVLLLPRVRSRSAWAAIFAGLALMSTAVMFVLHTPGSDPSRVYYGTDTRLLALLSGAFLACILTPGAVEWFRTPARWLAPVALLAVVGVMVVASDRSEWLYAGGFLLVAVISALLLASVVRVVESAFLPFFPPPRRDIPIIDPGPFLCDDGRYRAEIDGVSLHTDGVHFTEEGAHLYWEWLGPRLVRAARTPGATPAAPAP
ncbi:MAG: acyltransferase [Micrococcales bacterium]|nr:acyltransferase [Micrococcales bacterium]